MRSNGRMICAKGYPILSEDSISRLSKNFWNLEASIVRKEETWRLSFAFQNALDLHFERSMNLSWACYEPYEMPKKLLQGFL